MAERDSGKEEGGKSYPLWVRLILGGLQAWLVVFDYLAYIPFALFANPQDKLDKARRIKVGPRQPLQTARRCLFSLQNTDWNR